MHGRLAAFSRFNTRLSRASLWLAGMGLVAMTAIVFAQVFVRYVLNDSLLWVEPVAILLMAWFIFLGAAVGVHEAFHMGFDILVHFVPPKAGLTLRLISDIAVLIFAVAMVIFGWQLMAKTWGSSLPIIGLPGGFTYMPLFTGGVLMTLFTLEHVLKRLTGHKVEPDHPNQDDILQSEA